MSKKNKPLPKPPSTPFGRKRAFEENENKDTLMADQMAMAMAEGKLDEFLRSNIPDNEYARKLADMMMSMTGIMPAGGFSGGPAAKKEGHAEKPGTEKPQKPASNVQPPDDVVTAAEAGDVKSLMDILKREHKKRQGIEDAEAEETKQESASVEGQAVIEKEIIEQIIKIASDNNLTLDWIFFRAVKRYVQEYKKTGDL